MALVVRHGFRQHLQYYRLHQASFESPAKASDGQTRYLRCMRFMGLSVHACGNVQSQYLYHAISISMAGSTP